MTVIKLNYDLIKTKRLTSTKTKIIFERQTIKKWPG